MSSRTPLRRGAFWLAALAAAFGQLTLRDALGQTRPGSPIHFRVEGPSQRLEMVANTSRILTLDKKVPKAQVGNPDIVGVLPLSENKIQVSAKKPGVTQINIWDEDDRVHSVDVVVFGDARELEMVLKAMFPKASLKIRPLASSVVVSGYVDQPEKVSRVIRVAEDFYPKVISDIQVGGVQQVALQVKVMEVSRTKLRQMGFDWAKIDGSNFVVSSAAGLISAATSGTGTVVSGAGDTVRFGIVDGGSSFFGFLQALRRYNLVKVLAEPTLTAISGRPASFTVGGEFPIIVPGGLGTVSVEFKEFGTRVDCVPIVLGNGNIRLEVRPTVSEIDSARSVTIDSFTIPGLRKRFVDTAVEMKAGQTLALAGLIQKRTEAVNSGVPWLADLPYVGAGFRRVEEVTNEIELLILVTPQLVAPLDPHEVPPCGPGQFTTSPNDHELYLKGYIEVPKCCINGDCAACQGGVSHEVIPPGYTPQGTVPGGAAPQGQPVPPSPAQPQDNPPRPNQGAAARQAGASYAHRGRSPHVSRAAHRGAPVVHLTPTSRVGYQQPAQSRGSYQATRPAAAQPEKSSNAGRKIIGRVGYDDLDY